MSGFDTCVVVDWSGGNDTGPRPRKDAIWACVARGEALEEPVYFRNRGLIEDWLKALFETEMAAGRRVLAGFDFPFGFPAGFAQAVCGSDDPLALWSWLEARIEDAPRSNNRFDLAAEINLAVGEGAGPFWGNALARDIDGLARTMQGYRNPFPDRRVCETLAKGAFTCWQLAGAGAVGSQVLMGLPVLERLRRAFAGQVVVWPFERLDRPVALVEIWPSLTLGQQPYGMIRDAWQVRELAREIAGLLPETLAARLDVRAPEEGWIFGVVQERGVETEENRQTLAAPVPPPLRNDCFALPAGVDWVPVDDALAHLRDNLSCMAGVERLPVQEAADRVLAEDVTAKLSNPPHPNTAVDGYGFAGGRAEGPHVLPLVAERATAGALPGAVPEGAAIRVLTGARLPEGVDTVVLQEDVTVAAGQIAFNGPIRQGANTRRAGEDVVVGDVILRAGRRLTPADLALAAAAGLGDLPVRARLRVGVLSTGDELLPAGAPHAPGRIYDANRPMLLALISKLGCEAIDLGHVRDERAALRASFDAGAVRCDAMLTSGGASAGDEDHVSALLSEAGAMELWRIAVKPGRPLALGLWNGAPVFGLPGNPVAALVCALVFARPALGVLAGQDWREPQGFKVPAGFAKRKKPGRREFLRARVRGGVVERFESEGSGRISGLSWAEGLIELPDGAVDIKPGDPVRYIPYSSFLT